MSFLHFSTLCCSHDFGIGFTDSLIKLTFTTDVYKSLFCGTNQNPSLNVTWSCGTKNSCSEVKNFTMPWWTLTGSRWTLLTPLSPLLPDIVSFLSNRKCFHCKLNVLYFQHMPPYWHLINISRSCPVSTKTLVVLRILHRVTSLSCLPCW